MKIEALSIEGAYVVTPVVHGDPRGLFAEWYRADVLAAEIGHPLDLAQVNLSVSARGVVRGVHYALVPPSQAKYVMCPRGAVLDFVVDLRVGSPTFGRWEATRLDDVDRRAVYIAEGLGHGFTALTDDATLVYLCSATYNPAREKAVHPFDAELGIDWQVRDPVISARDAAAPSLAAARADGVLPDMAGCRAYVESLRQVENTGR